MLLGQRLSVDIQGIGEISFTAQLVLGEQYMGKNQYYSKKESYASF